MNILPKNFHEKILFATQIVLAKIINPRKNLNETSFKRILCIKLDEIGDLCYALHVFDILKQKYPNAEITLVCQKYCNTLVQNHPAISEVKNDFNNLNGNFDLIVDMRGSWQSIWYALTHRPKVYIERGSIRLRNKKTGHPHEVITNLQIIQPLFKETLNKVEPKLYIAKENTQKAIDFLTGNEIKNFAIIHPGARKPLKKWKPERFAQIALWLNQTYNFDIVIAGDNTETTMIENLQKQIPFKTFSIAGLLNLTDFAALVGMASLYVGNDSGPLSIASVSGTPSLGLYGPGVAAVFYPYGKKTDYIHYVLPCNPCNQINCVRPHDNCMDKISVQEVEEKITSLLKA
ncbi:MAG: glycosyltransferase family 9 protein [Bacteroidia bacterium]